MFIGTKKQGQEAIAEQATRVGMPYVNQRWLGGMLTNFQTVHKRIQRLKELEEIDYDDVAGSGLTKKELLVLRREKDKLSKTLGGIREMVKVPSAVWIVDTKKEHIAVGEARKLGIPVIAVLDTNCDPDEVDFPIPGNDDAIRAIRLFTSRIADNILEGLNLADERFVGDDDGAADTAEAPVEEESAAAEAPVVEEAAPTEPAVAEPEDDTAVEEPAEVATEEAEPEKAAEASADAETSEETVADADDVSAEEAKAEPEVAEEVAPKK